MSLKLSREQRARLFDSECPRISGEGQCPIEVGYVYRLSRRLEFRVLEIRRTKKGGWTLRYEVHDRRDPINNLRRVPSISFGDFKEIRVSFDEFGYPPPVDDEVRKEAAIESAYTSGPDSMVAGEGVNSRTQEKITKGDLASDAQQQYDRQRSQEAARRLARPPEDQIRDELEALRREAPKDARRYEVQLVQLADRIKAKRRRRAA